MSVTVSELEALYRNGHSEFARVASAICGSEQAGADAVQEAFAKAIRSRRSFRGDAPPEAWVWRIVVNTARSARSKMRHHDTVVEAIGLNGAATTERDDEVLAWIAALPGRQREAVFLRYFADMDYRTIAAVLGIEVGTVSATLNAAHRTLRQAMEASR